MRQSLSWHVPNHFSFLETDVNILDLTCVGEMKNLNIPLLCCFINQVSQVYQTIEMSRFAALVPFATPFRLERLIVNAARQLELQVST